MENTEIGGENGLTVMTHSFSSWLRRMANRASLSVVATDVNDLSLLKFGKRPSVGGDQLPRRRSSVLRDILTLKNVVIHPDHDDPTKWTESMVEYAPDGGLLAWTVAIASLMNNFVLDGISFSYGVVTNAITASGSMNEFQFHLCGSVMLGTTLLIGPLVSLLSARIGFRAVSLLGSFLAALGLFLCWAVSPEEPSFIAFLLGFGVLGGLGFGCMFTSSIVVLGKFFADNLPLATGVATTGSAVGSIVMPLVLGKLNSSLGWQGSWLFLAGCCASSLAFGALYFKPPQRLERVLIEDKDKKKGGDSLPQLRELLVSPTFWILSVSGGIAVLGYFVPPNFISSWAQASFNATEEDANYLPSMIGASNTVGRVIFGLIANSERAQYSLLMTNMAVTLGGLATIVSVYATDYWMLAVYSVIYGQVIAVYASLRSVIVYQLVGKDKFNLAFGVSLFFMGLASYFGNSFAGWLYEQTGNYDRTFQCVGSFFIVSAVLCYPLAWIHRFETAKRPRRFSTFAPNPVKK